MEKWGILFVDSSALFFFFFVTRLTRDLVPNRYKSGVSFAISAEGMG